MGTSSKPLLIDIHQSLYDAEPERWEALRAQGHTVCVMDTEEEPDIILAPYAMRMTADMLKQLPASFDLAVKGARTLKYGPTGKEGAWKSGKEKRGIQNKTKAKRKNSKVKVEDAASAEHGTITEDSSTGSTIGSEGQPNKGTNNAGDGQVSNG